MKVLENSDCVVSDAIVTDDKLNVMNTSMYNMLNVKHGRLYNLLCHNGYSGCCMAFKRKVLERALPFPNEIPMHDIWIGNVAAFFYSITFVKHQLVKFRRHDNVVSCNGKGSRYSIGRRIIIRLNTIKSLLRLAVRHMF